MIDAKMLQRAQKIKNEGLRIIAEAMCDADLWSHEEPHSPEWINKGYVITYDAYTLFGVTISHKEKYEDDKRETRYRFTDGPSVRHASFMDRWRMYKLYTTLRSRLYRRAREACEAKALQDLKERTQPYQYVYGKRK